MMAKYKNKRKVKIPTNNVGIKKIRLPPYFLYGFFNGIQNK